MKIQTQIVTDDKFSRFIFKLSCQCSHTNLKSLSPLTRM